MNAVGTGGPEPAKARRKIREETVTLLTRGWFWNTNWGLKLLPDQTGQVAVPGDVLSATVIYPDDRPIVKRGNRFFDLKGNTYNIGEAVTANLVRNLAWDLLPPAAHIVITDAACRRFQMATVGNAEYRAFDEYVLGEARAALHREEVNTSNVSLLDGSAAVRIPSGRRVVGWP